MIKKLIKKLFIKSYIVQPKYSIKQIIKMSCCSLFLIASVTSCGVKVSNTEQPPVVNTAFSFHSPDLDATKGDAAAGFMVFDDATDAATGTVLTFKAQQKNIQNPSITITQVPDEIVSYAFFVEPSAYLSNCEDTSTGCLNWAIINITPSSFGKIIEAGLKEDIALEKGAKMLVTKYIDKLDTNLPEYDVNEFSGISPDSNSNTVAYRLQGYALREKVNINDKVLVDLKRSSVFQKKFNSIIISKHSVAFTVKSKKFTIENAASRSFNEDSYLSDKQITCSSDPDNYGASPFDSPGISPHLIWKEAPASAAKFVLFMMADSVIKKDDNQNPNIGGPQAYTETPPDDSNYPTKTSTSTIDPADSFRSNCDFEYCRHWAVFNIDSQTSELVRGEDFSTMPEVIIGKHLYHTAYYYSKHFLQKEGYKKTTFDTTINATVVSTTRGGTFTWDDVTAYNNDATIADKTRGYFGPCAPVSLSAAPTPQRYTISLIPIDDKLANWIATGAASGTVTDTAKIEEAKKRKEFIQRLSLNNFLYYFSSNATDRRRQKPGCEEEVVCYDEFGFLIPDKAELLEALDENEPANHIMHSAGGASVTFYDIDDDCELCRFCLIGSNSAATPQVPLNMWRQFGYEDPI